MKTFSIIRVDWRAAKSEAGLPLTNELGQQMFVAYLKEASTIVASDAVSALQKAKLTYGPLILVQERTEFRASIDKARQLSREKRYGQVH